VQFKSKSKKRVLINITSLIDVLFLLLIFFMVSSTFLEQPGMKLELPEAKSSEVTRVEKLILYISPHGELLFNDKPVPIDSLQQVLVSAIPSAEEKTLTLKADKTVQVGTVVKVMDIAKRAGLKKLVVGTRVEGE